MSFGKDRQPSIDELFNLVQEQQCQIAELQKLALTKRRFTFAWLSRSSLLALTLIWLPLVLNRANATSIPAPDGVVTGCYNIKDGALRVIDAEAGQLCLAKETMLT
jgi:hypothetical protein